MVFSEESKALQEILDFKEKCQKNENEKLRIKNIKKSGKSEIVEAVIDDEIYSRKDIHRIKKLHKLVKK